MKNNYLCKKISGDIEINGDLNKEIWASANEATLLETVSGKEPKQRTTFKALWNEKFLYVGFACEDNYINATLTSYNDPIYNEDVVEVFIDENNDKKSYTEIEVSPLNTVLHYLIHNNLAGEIACFARIDKIVKSAVLINNLSKTWCVEIQIPFSEFVLAKNHPPLPGDEWGVNFYRIEKSEDGSEEYSAFCPTGLINFHKPECFGKLVFAE
ncbi:MAG: carbohydrate-binding family 9-like protein [Clostridia bacterium]|nr:carbohydrate-binding family 9-like protein [Clostridia bacterium]